MLTLTDEESKTLQQECETLLKVKQILQEFCNDKSNQYEDYPGDLNDPLFLLPERLERVVNELEMVYVIKQKQIH